MGRYYGMAATKAPARWWVAVRYFYGTPPTEDCARSAKRGAGHEKRTGQE